MVKIKGWKEAAVGLLPLLFATGPALAYYDEYDDSEAHPLRLVAYALHPVGYTLEWLVLRPIHAIVSQPQLEPVFGHYPHEAHFGYAPAAAAPPPIVAPPSPAAPEAAPPPTAPEKETGAVADPAAEAKKAAEEAKKAAQAAEAAAERAERAFGKALRKQ